MEKRSKAFFSIDAGFAIILAVLMFASFSLLHRSAYLFASSYAKDVSGTNLALRLSSHIMNEAGAKHGDPLLGSYSKPGELDALRMQPPFLEPILHGMVQGGKFRYARVAVSGSAIPMPASEAGAQGAENYCVKRLALMEVPPLMENEIVLMEVCVS